METTAVRSFARTFTERIGVLERSFLGRGRPLGEARLLWEIGAPPADPVDVATLRERLRLDAGYTSRLLRALETDGLIVSRSSPADGRARVVSLTTAGRSEWAELERRSDERAAVLLGSLDERRRSELADLLRQAERLLVVADASFDTVDARSADAVAAMTAYFAELDERFVGGFDAGDAIDTDAPAFDPPAGAFVLVRCGDAVAGCGAVQTLEPHIGEIKRMWIDPAWRSLGLARRLLEHLESIVAGLGHQIVRLDTNAVLAEAIAMYERAGYRSIDRYNDNPYAQRWFEKSLS